MADRSPGQAAYEAYFAMLTGTPGTRWAALGDHQQTAWEAAATAAIEATHGN